MTCPSQSITVTPCEDHLTPLETKTKDFDELGDHQDPFRPIQSTMTSCSASVLLV